MPSEAFQLAFAAGARAAHAGRYDEAIARYEEAQRLATRLKDRDEAAFLIARMWEAKEDPARALAAYDALVRLSPDGPRRVRSELAAAVLAERRDRTDGRARYDALVRAFPDDELVELALDRLLALEGEDRGASGRLALATRVAGAAAGKRIEEHARYRVATALRELGRKEEARDAFVACARRFGYPKGSLTDDALFHAAELEMELGRPREAAARLREMMAPREQTAIGGSYERPRFGEGQLLLAKALVAAGDRAGARAEYRRLYASFRSSLYRDDALWEEAKLWAADGRSDEACGALALLVKDFPDSRYVACVAERCPSLPAGKRECPDYLKERAPASE